MMSHTKIPTPTALSALALLLLGCLWPAAAARAGEQKINGSVGGCVGPIGVSDQFGHAIAPIGDFGVDGVDDVAVGAPCDDTYGTNAGTLYRLTLSSEGQVVTTGKLYPNLPSGTTFYAQWWVPDAGGPAGFQASNGLQCVQK